MKNTNKNGRKIEAYPTRSITLSEEVWEELKTAKIGYGENWNRFIKVLLSYYPEEVKQRKFKD